MSAQRCDQFGVEDFQMAVSGLKQWLFEALRVGGTHAEFRKLESEKVKEMKDAGENSDGSNFDGILGDHGGNEAVSRRVVFDERSSGGDGGLQSAQGKISRGFEGGVFAFVRRQFPQGA